MKIISMTLALLCFTTTSFAQDNTVDTNIEPCENVVKINHNFIYKNSAPLRAGGEGTPLLGYEEVPTLIMKKDVSNKGLARVFDTTGNLITKCGWRTATGFPGGRFKCASNTRGMRKAAIKKSGTPAAFFKINRRTCIRIPDIGKCYGSVKGKCNQILK